jgi:hypothetical protein
VFRLLCDLWTDTKSGAAVDKSVWRIERWPYTGSIVVADLCNLKKQDVPSAITLNQGSPENM